MERNSKPLPKMVERLRTEHRNFILDLIQIEEASQFSSRKAIEKLKEVAKSILRHELEEEGRIIQIIMKKVKDPEQSVKIIGEHRRIIDLLENKISQLEGSSKEVDDEMETFANDIRKHFSDEEQIVFPLALKII